MFFDAAVHRCAVEQVWAAGKHKRRINCGAWSYQNQLAYGSDDKQISVTSETGQIQDQVCTNDRRRGPPSYVTPVGSSG